MVVIVGILPDRRKAGLTTVPTLCQTGGNLEINLQVAIRNQAFRSH